MHLKWHGEQEEKQESKRKRETTGQDRRKRTRAKYEYEYSMRRERASKLGWQAGRLLGLLPIYPSIHPSIVLLSGCANPQMWSCC